MIDFRLSPSPFKTGSPKPEVYVSGGLGPAGNVRKALRGIDLSPVKGKKVLLKPNAGRVAPPGSAVNTNPEAVGAALDAFIEAGAALAAVGESPITGVDTKEAFEVSGIAAAARARGCPLVDMDAGDREDVTVPGGAVLKSLRICKDIMDYDIIVSMPVMKTHMHTAVTLSVKNMKGCLWRRSKVRLHMLPPVDGSDEKPINIAIAEMAGILKPHLTIIDGYHAMEGLGPGAGHPRTFDRAVAGVDPFACDAVACALMGMDPFSVPHLRLGAGKGLGVIDLDSINVSPGHWRDWAESFESPPASLSIEFPGVTVLDKNSCSACQSTLLLFLRGKGKSLSGYFDGPVNIAIGKGHEDVPPGTLCIGNCAAKHKDKGVFAPGCPPVGSEIMETLERAAKERR
jgi:uncharacterized protein (DUF362 family)